jgi:glycosyltransferase involved in cell wall biosynthesis
MARRGILAADLHVVPNGVDTDRFIPTAPDESTRVKYGLAGKKVVAYLGSFFAFEGVELLERALIKLIKEHGREDIRGMIVGEGPTYERCRAIAAGAGLADKILHPGRVPPGDVNALYSIADVLAYPREGHRVTELVTPLKPLEAMAMEKAVVGSSVGGLRELIQDGATGLLHRHGDANDLAQKIARLVDDEGLRRRLGRQAREWVVEHRQWRTLIRRHFEVYERAHGARSRRGALRLGIEGKAPRGDAA